MAGDAKQFKLGPELTKAGWEKQKGLLAKIFKADTGIGSALGILEAKHKDVKWDELFATAPKAELAKVHGLIDFAETVEEKADKTLVEFKKSKLIPKASEKAVLAISASAANLKDGLKQFYDSKK